MVRKHLFASFKRQPGRSTMMMVVDSIEINTGLELVFFKIKE